MVVDAERISSWKRLVRVLAFCKRFVDNIRAKVKSVRHEQMVKIISETVSPRNVLTVRKYEPKLSEVVPPLTPEEMEWAETRILRACQAQAFPKDMIRLMNVGHVSPRSNLRQLRPCLGHDGLIRVNARLRASTHLDRDMKHPIILPKGHHVTRLVIQHYHQGVLKHTAGSSHTLAQVNQRFWINGGRSEVRRVLAQCTPCRRKNATMKHQEMAPLPEQRFVPESTRMWPFYHTGVDAAGPFEVNLGRGTRRNQALHKRWFIIFTCSVYRCVHFEVVRSLSADAFLQAFSRFLARRPRPRHVNSDNGGNFEGGCSVIDELMKNLQQNHAEVAKEYADIKWTFNTPLSPHQGGHFERLIGSMKKSLAAVLPSAGPLWEEEFNTCLVVCEGLLNSRPISYVSSDPNDFSPLTPAHFLMQAGYQDIAAVTGFKPTRQELCDRWLHIQRALDRLWSRFIQEVVPQMNKMNAWTTKRKELQAGDIVVLLENKVRGIWPIGKITETYKNKQDGHVRRAKVLCNGKMYDRSLARIMVIQESPPLD